MQREFFICAFQSSFLRLNDASMFQKYSCQVSKPSDVSGRIFFQKSDGRRRSKEDFLPRFKWWVQLLNLPRCYHGVPYLRSQHVHAFPVSPHSASFLQLSSSKFLDFSLCFLSFELLCLTVSSHPTFLSKRRSSCSSKHSITWSFLFEASRLSTRCGKVGFHVSTSEIEFTSCRSRRDSQSCTQWSCLVSSQGMIAWRGWSNRKGGSVVWGLFSFVSVDSCWSTGERKTGSATWDWQEHLAFVCFVSLSLFLSLSLPLSFSLETCTSFFFFSFSSLSSASAIVEIDELLGACCSPAAEPPRKQICRRRL